MKKIMRIASADEHKCIDVMQAERGEYLLYGFVKKYDSEEEKYYEIREMPDPAGKFGELDAAIQEAKRILDIFK